MCDNYGDSVSVHWTMLSEVKFMLMLRSFVCYENDGIQIPVAQLN